jgi:16S rRNA (guanine966-N2)-methyltransferase
VRGAIFDIIAERVVESQVLDLYCGTGALGLEAISRGAKVAAFVDNHRTALEAVRSNAETLGFIDRVKCYNRNLPRQIDGSLGSCFDLIFSDPPYKKCALNVLAEILWESSLLKEDGIWVHEMANRASVDIPPYWSMESQRRYGDTQLILLRPSQDP